MGCMDSRDKGLSKNHTIAAAVWLRVRPTAELALRSKKELRAEAGRFVVVDFTLPRICLPSLQG